MTSRPSVRVTILGPEPLRHDVDPDVRDADDGTRTSRPAFVAPLTPSPAQGAAGQTPYDVLVDGWWFEALAEPAARAQLRETAARSAAAAGAHVQVVLRAQIPGRVVRVWVAAGDHVEAGDRLLALEAMKMENEIRAPRAGVVEAVRVSAGQTCELGDELAVLG